MKTWLLVLVAVSAMGQAAEIQKPQRVDSQWLRARQSNPNVRTIDARDLKSYLDGHMAGAVFLTPETLRFSQGGVPARLFEPTILNRIFGGIGIGPNTDVVIYSSATDDLASSTFIATILEAQGHANVAVLDGGFEAWNHWKGSVDKGVPKAEPRPFTGKREPIVVDVNFVRQNAPNINLLDARPTAVYEQGHLPGAKNLPLKKLLTETTPAVWKSREALLEELRLTGYDPLKPIVTYCTTGREASMLYFTLKHVAGLPNVRVYLGSMLDWRSHGLPVEP